MNKQLDDGKTTGFIISATKLWNGAPGLSLIPHSGQAGWAELSVEQVRELRRVLAE